MNRYDLQVRGETVHIYFSRINDSRRLDSFYTNKKPNLFHIRAAMKCHVTLPLSFTPDWWKNSPSGGGDSPLMVSGFGFCHYLDTWSAQKGRHRALAEALDYLHHEKVVNADIVAAFTAEEKRRMKVKGPARTLKTAKPKPRRRRASTFERIADALEKLANPMRLPTQPPMVMAGAGMPNEYLQAGEMDPNVRPADIPARGCTPTCNANLIPGAAHNCGLSTNIQDTPYFE